MNNQESEPKEISLRKEMMEIEKTLQSINETLKRMEITLCRLERECDKEEMKRLNQYRTF